MLSLATQCVNSRGHLEIGGCDAVDLAAEFGTPLYVMDEAAIRQNCREYRAAFAKRYPRVEVYYASKAFLTLAMARLIAQEGLCMDVASLGELHVALAAGFPSDRLAMHGNNKSREELEAAVSAHIRHIVIDNEFELEMLLDVAAEHDSAVDVMVRATPGVDPHTHRLIRTGQADTKFGLNIADGAAIRAIKRIAESPLLRLRGVHCHIGSQLLDSSTHEEAVGVMVGLLRQMRDEVHVEAEELNIGGGLGVRYLAEHQPPDYDQFADRVTGSLKAQLDAQGLKWPVLAQEPGRSLVGEAGVTLYTVGAIKTVPTTEEPGTRTYVAVDGGLSDNPRPQMYQASYTCLLANRAAESADTLVTIAGKHCETDILIWDTRIPAPASGDLLAVQTTGAYNFVMASNYNRFLRPAVVLTSEGRADLVVARETLQDLTRNERIPERLCTPGPPA